MAIVRSSCSKILKGFGIPIKYDYMGYKLIFAIRPVDSRGFKYMGARIING